MWRRNGTTFFVSTHTAPIGHFPYLASDSTHFSKKEREITMARTLRSGFENNTKQDNGWITVE
jgi:hypothetical protein